MDINSGPETFSLAEVKIAHPDPTVWRGRYSICLSDSGIRAGSGCKGIPETGRSFSAALFLRHS